MMTLQSLMPTLWSRNGLGQTDPFAALRQEIDRAFESFGRALPSPTWGREAAMPRVNVTRNEKALTVTAELPGVELKDVELLVDGDMLTIKGEKTSEREDKTAERQLYECTHGAFSRTIPLPFDADPKAVSADFKNGVLKVTIAVPADAQPKAKKVEIKAAA
jgi:HSP20 family protein